MKKFDNFTNCFRVLRGVDFEDAEKSEIYRMGIAGQFHLTFELAWKALQETLRLYSVQGAEGGSPREIIKLAYKIGWLENGDVWLLMLKCRNVSVHVYDENEIEELLVLIRDSFIPAFSEFEEMLRGKIAELEDEGNWD